MVLFKEVLDKSCDSLDRRDGEVVGTCYFDDVKERRFDAEDLSEDVNGDNVAKFSDKYDIPHSTLKEKVKQINKFASSPVS